MGEALRDRRALAAAAVLFAVMVAHTILETARDALFIARLGADRLAWAYLGIAGAAFVAVTVVRDAAGVRDPRRLLIGFLLVAVAGTSALAATLGLAPSVVFLLYVWTGLVATLVVPSFWTTMDRCLPVTAAKRAFALIAAGGTLGAMVGSGVAAVLGAVLPARALVVAGALAFAVATLVAIWLVPRPPTPVAAVRRPQAERTRPQERSRGYIRMLVLLAIVSTVTLTLGDLAFKRVMSDRLPATDLATAFGAIYTGLNLFALIVQLVVTPRVLARLGVGEAMLVLPLIVVATAAGFAVTGAAIAILALKLGDGGLRHSLHRVASEILFLPVPATMRDGAKPIADALGHRGGQAAAALIAVAIGSWWSGAQALATGTALLGSVWLVTIAFVRRAYVRQFRDTLKAGELRRDVRAPELDADATRLLTEALSSPEEAEAIAALDVLAHRGGHVPALVLYHPSESVVRRALGMLGGNGRPDVARVLSYLLAHADPQVRASALVVAGRSGAHDAQLLEARAHRDPVIRAAAHVALVVRGVDDGTDSLRAMVEGSSDERRAVAHAIGFAPGAWARPLIDELLAHRDPQTLRKVLHVLAREPHLADLSRMLGLLANPHVRGEARRVFVATGAGGLARLIEALDDPRVPVEVRRHVPRTISRFRSREAIAALVARLPREPDGTTEFKILRALGRMRLEDPGLPIDVAVMRGYVERSVSDAARYTVLADHLRAGDPPASAGAELLAELLAEKRRNAIEHVFRALGVVHPRLGLHGVHDAITGADVDRRAAAREIIEDLLPLEPRGALVAVLEDLAPERRAERLGAYALKPPPSYEALIALLLEDPSESLRCVAAYHVAERRMLPLRAELTRLRATAAPPLVIQAFDQAITRLDA